MKNIVSMILLSTIVSFTMCDLNEASKISDNDIELMYRVVMSEASTLEYRGKYLTACTILNRLESNHFPDNIPEIIEGQYSTQDNGDPTDEVKAAVLDALINNETPEDLFYFRSGKPHDWAWVWEIVGNTFFQTNFSKPIDMYIQK